MLALLGVKAAAQTAAQSDCFVTTSVSLHSQHSCYAHNDLLSFLSRPQPPVLYAKGKEGALLRHAPTQLPYVCCSKTYKQQYSSLHWADCFKIWPRSSGGPNHCGPISPTLAVSRSYQHSLSGSVLVTFIALPERTLASRCCDISSLARA